jgi:hypothetical protein
VAAGNSSGPIQLLSFCISSLVLELAVALQPEEFLFVRPTLQSFKTLSSTAASSSAAFTP